MIKKNIVVIISIISLLSFSGCSQKNNPTAPENPTENTEYSSQLYNPPLDSIIKTGRFSGDPGIKPGFWFDANDNAAFGASIITNDNGQSSNITRTVGNTWGKVRTFASNASSEHNQMRIFVVSRSESVSWKLLIQEEGGAWRNWVLQNSTGQTGYVDYDFTTINNQILSGSGQYTVEIVVEGAVGQYIEVAELYVFKLGESYRPSEAYWVENFCFTMDVVPGNHTAGWLDSSTNPEFNCSITNVGNYRGVVTPGSGGGKVVSPVISWSNQLCQKAFVGVYQSNDQFEIEIQEQSGSYRHFPVTKTYLVTGAAGTQGYQADLSSISGLADGTPVSLVLYNVEETLNVRTIGIFPNSSD